jgi:bifunctional non-homologous end joining protein LigD
MSALPKLATTEIRKAKRGGRVYIDIMQNVRAHHVVPPFSLRAVPTATISVPLSWTELDKLKSPDVFTVDVVRRRLKLRQPWTADDLFSPTQERTSSPRRMRSAKAAARRRAR